MFSGKKTLKCVSCLFQDINCDQTLSARSRSRPSYVDCMYGMLPWKTLSPVASGPEH